MRLILAIALALSAAPTASAGAVAGASAGGGPARAAAGRPCVRPVANTGARCAFDVWGVVTDPDGPLMGAVVAAGGRSVVTDSRGFYDLYLPGPGSYRLAVTSRPGCELESRVDVGPSAVTSGGVNRNVALSCRRASYKAFGFSVVQNGVLITVARRGVWHAGGVPGRLDWFHTAGGRTRRATIVDTDHDDRNAAGGLTRSGALLIFSAQLDAADGAAWQGMQFVRAARDATVSGTIPTGRLTSYSPYGPLVVLPSGRLMQTFYGSDGNRWRIYTSFSSDDGRSWSGLTPVDASPPFQANEAAAVYVDGATDAQARLVLVARADGLRNGSRWFGLVQYVSPDGGRTWLRRGLIESTKSRREAIPWVASLSGGRLALVWADRGSLTLKRSIAPFSAALAMRWGPADVLYRSRVADSPQRNIGDFGYPSIASYGPQDARKAIVFNDADPEGSVGGFADVDMLALPLWAGPGTRPLVIAG